MDVKKGEIDMKKIIIMRVRTNKRTKQKTITIPKNCDIEEGDYVKVQKVKIV